ncbi:C35C5.3 [Symbiodinium natans]|uniref:C35C5.3 protein n=1 Tax=Symbiodinium natans TaxID=878477 RepID=A0A812P6Y5_9DINO|nr:C35C5.3 [Symbiodinium natans]
MLENEAVLKAHAAGTRVTPAVLVLGGSTFMGRETVHALLQLPARVCVVNRGRSYWGTRDPSNGRVARVVADRRDKHSFSERLDEVTTKLEEKWALVADFSAYDGADISCALKGLRGRFETYAYISSDSVYEVSSAAGSGWAQHAQAQAVDESFSQRPADDAVRKRLRKADSYGDGKLEAEEALAAGLEHTARGVALRLPDVIGPFDDTLRLWAYWHWLRVPDNPPQVRKQTKRARLESSTSTHSFEDPPLAFVFSRDVARFLVQLIGQRLDKKFDAVNVGSDMQVPLKDFLDLLGKASKASKASSQGPTAEAFDEVDRPRSFLPSVERPLPLDFRHLKQTYAFQSTPLPDVLKICADWFSLACEEFPEEAAEAAMKLPAAARNVALASAELPPPKSPASSSNSSTSSSHS